MIEYLKIEIRPTHFSETDLKELVISVNISGKPPFGRIQIIEQDELVSFFEQIWDCAGKELLKAIKVDTKEDVPVVV